MHLIELYSREKGSIVYFDKTWITALPRIGEYLIYLSKIYRVIDIGHDLDRKNTTIIVK